MLDAQPILRALTDGQGEFVVVGGLAVITHGSAHVTDDLDICYRRTDENIARLDRRHRPAQTIPSGHPAGTAVPV